MRKLFSSLLALTALWCLGAVAVNAKTIYVTPSGAGNKDGSDWLNAYAAIEAAIAAASSGDEIWIAGGTYKPLSQMTITKSLSIYGGFVGNETNLDDRTETSTIVDFDSKAYNFVVNTNGISVIFDGLTLQKSTASNVATSGTIHIGGNSTSTNTGNTPNVSINNCRFLNNNAYNQGGGVYIRNATTTVTIEGCYFEGNIGTSSCQGAAIYFNAGGTCDVINSIIVKNTSSNGGAVYFSTGTGRVINSIIAGNKDTRTGTGYSRVGGLSGGTAYNTIFYNNTTLNSDQVWNFNGTTIYNCITDESTTNNSIIQTDASKLFSDYANGDYTPTINSYAINRGTSDGFTVPTTDFAGNQRVVGLAIDMGPYEYQTVTYPVTVKATNVTITPTLPINAINTPASVLFTIDDTYHSPYVTVNGKLSSYTGNSSTKTVSLFDLGATAPLDIAIYAYPKNVIPVTEDTYIDGTTRSTAPDAHSTNYATSSELRIRKCGNIGNYNEQRAYVRFVIPGNIVSDYNKATLKIVASSIPNGRTPAVRTVNATVAAAPFNTLTWDNSDEASSYPNYSGSVIATAAQTSAAITTPTEFTFDVSSEMTGTMTLQLADNVLTDGTSVYFSLENGNPNYVPVLVFSQPTLKVLPTETKTYIPSGEDAHGDIIIYSDATNTGQIDNSANFTVNGAIKFVKTFTPSEWYPIGFPFDLNGVYVDDFKNDEEGPWVVAHQETNNVVGDYWLKTYAQGTATVDQWADTIAAQKGYAIAFPSAFTGNEVTFISQPNITISTASYTPSGTATYAMVANPTLQDITLAEGGNYYYYTYVAASNRFLRITSGYGGSSTVHPFESFIVAYSSDQNSLRSSFSVEEATDIPYLRDMEYLDDPIVKTEYYNLQGQKYSISQRNGISNGTPYIVKTITQSGKVTSRIEIR
jgi:hypothetical protein